MKNFKSYFSINIFRIISLLLEINEYVMGQVIRKRKIKKCESYHLGLLVGIALFFAIPNTYCQIQGSVKNDKGQPIAFTNILVLEKVDSSLIQGVICDEFGKFSLTQVPKGSYLISAQMLGYEPVFSSPVLVEGSNDQIMEFILKEEMSELSEVLVSAQKPLFEQQMGKLVVNVNSSIISSGSTVLEVLSRTPGIQINQQNNTITMNGKDGVMIMLNGKLVRLPLNAVVQMLSGMNADQVSTIEVINSPPARYDAEGTAGLINIISKENLEMGTNGSFSGNFGTSFDKETLERFGGAMNINHRSKKVSFYLNASARRDNLILWLKNSRSINPNGVGIKSITEQERDIIIWTLNGQGGFEIAISTNTSIGGQLTGTSTKQDQIALGETKINNSNGINTLIDVKDMERHHWWGYGTNLYLTHKFTNESFLNFDLDYLYYFHNNPHNYRFMYSYNPEQSEKEELLVNDKHTPIHIWVAKTDLKQRLREKFVMEMGLKGTLSDIENKILAHRFRTDEWLIDTELSQHVLMKENIGAAYVTLDGDLGSTTKLQAGLRYEHTYTHLENSTGEPLLERNYGNLFPNFSLSKKFNDDYTIMLSYGRRITRPTYNDLTPAVTFFDPFNLLMGNMELLPSLSHSVQANFQIKKAYSINFDITHIQDFIGWDILAYPDQNFQLLQKNNFDNNLNTSLSLSAPNNFTPWWEGNSSVQGVYQKVTSISQEVLVKRNMAYVHVNSTQSFRLGNGYTAEVSGFYISPQLRGLLTHKSYGTLNLGFQKELHKNKGSLKISAEDILWNNRLAFVNRNAQIGFESDLNVRRTTRIIRLTYSKNFGRSGIKSVKKGAGSEEERKRVQ